MKLNSNFQNKLISFFFTFVIILSSFTFSFGADDEGTISVPSDSVTGVELPESTLLSTVTDPEAIEIDNKLRYLASVAGAQASSDTGCDCGTTVNNIYSLLTRLFGYQNGTLGWWVHDKDVLEALTVTTATGSKYSIASYVYDLYDLLIGELEYRNSYNLVDNIYHSRLYLAGGLFDGTTERPYLETMISILSSFASSNHSDLVQFLSDVNNFKSANHTDILGLRDDYNNINWVSIPDTVSLHSSFDDAITGSNPLSGTAYLSSLYVFMKSTISKSGLLHLFVPYYNNSVLYLPDLDFTFRIYLANGVDFVESDFPYFYSVSRFGIDFYFQNIQQFNWRVVLGIVPKKHSQFYVYNTNHNVNLSYLSSDSKDYVDFYNYLSLKHIDSDLHYQNSQLDKLVSVYADDVTIAAKQANQSNEQTVLTDFTGSGDAAVSGSDLGNLKSSGSVIKGGFNGGKTSDALNIFSGGSSVWAWFTQDNYNTLNDLFSTDSGSNGGQIGGGSSGGGSLKMVKALNNNIQELSPVDDSLFSDFSLSVEDEQTFLVNYLRGE